MDKHMSSEGLSSGLTDKKNEENCNLRDFIAYSYSLQLIG